MDRVYGGLTNGVALKFNLRFPGQLYDQETGLHYNYFRDYDPVTGRYIESDPIGLEGGVNTYGYVGASPTGGIDKFGLIDIFGPGYLPVPRPGEEREFTACEKEAIADLLIDMVPLTAYLSLAMDVSGVGINPVDGENFFEVGNYGEKTPYAVAGHVAGYAAGQYSARSERLVSRARDNSVSYSVNRGRLNRADAAKVKAISFKALSKILGPAGAIAAYKEAWEKCQCQP